MRPTLFGFQSLAFYASMVLAYFASPYANLSFLLLAFLTLTGLFGLWWGLRNMRAVGAELAELEPLPSGPGNRLRARVHAGAARSGGRGTRFGIRVRLTLESGEVLEGLAPVLPERAGEGVSLEVPGLARGVYPIARAEVLSTYPLGLFERRRAIEAPDDLAVYPAPSVDTEARTGAQLLAEVLGSTAVGGEQLQPAGLRDYVEGDSLRSVHWRATARRGHPVVREWDGSGGGGLELCIDRRATEEELEEALGITSAVLRLAREQKEALSISSQGLSETYGPGHRPWGELLRFLAEAERLEPDAPAPPPVSPAVTRLPARGGQHPAAGQAREAVHG